MQPTNSLRPDLLKLVLLLFAGLLCRAEAGPGDVDLSFDAGSGVDGLVTAVATQSDGKVVIGGQFSTVKGLSRASVARLNADGSGDSSFDLGAGAIYQSIGAIAVQADGKVLVGHAFGVVRLNADGSPDPTFNANLYSEASYYDAYVSALAVQQDGKVLVGGSLATFGSEWNYGIARLNPDGSVDPGFNPGTFSDYYSDTRIRSIFIQADGRVIVGGSLASTLGGSTSYGVARLNANGTLDPSFHADGSVYWTGEVNAVVAQADGKVIVAGSFDRLDGLGRVIDLRFATNGSLDSTFNPLSEAADVSGNLAVAYSLALQNDGKALVAGNFETIDGVTQRRVTRLLLNGSIDTSFNSGVAANTYLYAMCLQPDGAIVVAGEPHANVGRVGRLQPNGTADSAFDSGRGLEYAVGTIELQPDGKILVNGLRLHSDGSRDATYVYEPPTPTVAFDISVPGTSFSGEESRAIQPDGKVLIGGSTYTEQYDWDYGYYYSYSYFLYRFNPDGARDSTFQPALGPVSYWDPQTIRQLVLLPDGKILAGGIFNSIQGTTRNGLARLNANGSIDTAFAPNIAVYPLKLILEAEGSLLVGSQSGLHRLDAAGQRDLSFASGTGANGTVYAITIEADGRILIGGAFTEYNSVNRSGIARVRDDGSLDDTFDPGTGTDAAVLSMVLQPDGNILIGGHFNQVNGHLRSKLARLISYSNARPSVTITSPAIGSTFAAPQNVAITASASDNGSVARVDFFAGSNLVGSDSSAPFACTWENAPAGNHSLRAVATDDLGASGSSASVTITVTNSGPLVSITTPAVGAVFAAPATVAIAADASDSDGSIARVDFYGDSLLISSDHQAPFEATWNQVRGGNHVITAVATDNRAASTASAPVSITVTNVAPAVNITGPTAGATFVAPASIGISINASDSDGVVTRVDVYAGSTLIGSDTVAPFAVSWSNVSAGSYSLTARATDDAGATTTSAPVGISVAIPAPPAAPSGLTGTAVTRTANQLNWADRSSNEVGFKIERSNNGKSFTEIARVPMNVTTYTNSGISRGPKYSYRVRSYNTGGDSAYSNTVTIK